MTGRTHLTVGLAIGGALALSQPTPEAAAAVVIASALGALLPDIDHPASLISGYPILGLISRAMSVGGVRHRGITHSLLFVVALAVVAWLIHPALGVAMGAGMASHLVLDMLTPSGVALLQPLMYAPIKLAPGVVLALLKPLTEAMVFVGGAMSIFYVIYLASGRVS